MSWFAALRRWLFGNDTSHRQSPAPPLAALHGQKEGRDEDTRENEERDASDATRQRLAEERATGAEARARLAEENATAAEARARRAEDDAREAEARARLAIDSAAKAEARARLAEENAREAEERSRRAEGRASKAAPPSAGRDDAHPEERDRPPPKNERVAGGGKRIAELERRVEEAEQHAARYRSRAEDAERALAEIEAREGAKREAITTEHRANVRRLEDRARDAERAVRRGEPPDAPRRPSDPRARGAETGTAQVWWSPGEECFEAIAREIDDAERTVDACVFTITDDRLANALLAAHRRGTRVRVITDNDKSHDEGSDVGRLARAGIEVRVDRTEFHMHHKFAVFDGERALTGSYNWTRGAARNNEEHVVVTDDPRLVDALRKGFDRLWRKFEA